MKRKILSLILVFAMTVSLLTVGTGAVEPTYGDTAGHWAESSIERWSAYGIIQGSNGQFDPNGQLTCAQLATILAKLLKLPAAKDAGFTDNTADAWYYDAINRCAAAGILNGNGDGTVTPDAPISRERAIVMLGRALGIEPIRKPDLTKYTDAAKVAPYAQGMVAAMIEAGIVGGVTADELAPQDNITRAATVTILDRAISTYADKAGATVKADGKGIVLVVAENVKITGAPEGTKIVVADGATGLTVNGKSVSDDQTYIVPKTTTSSGSSSSGGHSHTHSYTETITTPATCTADGEKKLTCSCGDTKTEVIPALGHDVNGVAYIPNGDAHLRHYQECKRCKEKIFADCTYEMTPGETEDTYKCSVCGDTYKVAKDSAVRIGEAGYTTLDDALAADGEDNTIVLLKDLEVAAQINVTKSVTIEGAGHIIKANNASWPTDYSNKHLLNIQNTSNVTIKNLTLDSNNQAYGNQAYSATGVAFNDVTMVNSKGAGLTVNRSTVTANNLTTSDNTWGGVNVDPKADNGTLHFTLTGNSTLSENNQIWAEKVNGPTVVTADGYYCRLDTNNDDTEFYYWNNTLSDNAAAKVKVGEVDVYYTSLEKALSENAGAVEITLVKDATLNSGATGVQQGQTRNIKITGAKDIKLSLINTAPGSEGSLNYQDGANLTFNGITVDASKIAGICARGAAVTFENCVFNTELKKTIANKFEFTGCTFTQPVSQVGYGCEEVLFDNCKFNTNGYGIKIYSEGSTPVNLTVKNSAFKNTGNAAKSAIFLDHIIDGISYSINVEKCTFEGFTFEPTPNANPWATRVIVSDSFVKSGDQYVFSYQTGKEGGSYHKILTADKLTVIIDGAAYYTLDQFNALTSIPAAAEKVYVDLGNASLQNGLTIGNDNIADHYHYGEWNSDAAPSGYPLKTNIDNFTTHDGEKIRYIYSTGKSAVNIILTGSVTGATDTGDFNAGAITLKVPDAANVIFDTVIFGEGQMAMSMWTESHVQSMTVSHRLASVTFNGCTFKGNWLQNGAFGADEMTITGCTFEKHENTAGIKNGFDCKNNSNPIWIQNMGQTNVTIEGCTINAVRPIKLWENDVSGTAVIKDNVFDMSKCSIDNDSTHKNIAVMFSTINWSLGNVEISGNTVKGDATALVCFGDASKVKMAKGATFKISNNKLADDVKALVTWKSNTELTGLPFVVTE